MKHVYRYLVIPAALTLACMPATADGRGSYISPGESGPDFATRFESWNPGQQWNDDDNFFISRVKPRKRFRNKATQVNPDFDETNDKKLIYWVPNGIAPMYSLPTPDFDGDVFSMWSYVTHFGNWNAPFMRCPGSFTDIAHKNGVSVSTLAAIPYGKLDFNWAVALRKIIDQGPDKMADYLRIYGIDGIGYNSEFSISGIQPDGVGRDFVKEIAKFNTDIAERGMKFSPDFTNVWYDGTSTSGRIMFDLALSTHNEGNFGTGEEPAASLFLNYNWNKKWILERSVENAEKLGRSPLDLYCGFNMQGIEPSMNSVSWTMLKDYPLSIGLWGAHSESMMFESRGERGFSDAVKQQTYLTRTERFFTGGTRNPVTSPEISDKWHFNADNYDFFGMSRMMSARSALSWDLSEEPFITAFNLGNGTFFNWRGTQANSRPWTNIGVQDYLPTWRFWFASRFLGNNPADVPFRSLDANFVWDDAWTGGSLLKITGSAVDEYLHLFKTSFQLKDGDEITLRYKLNSGSTRLGLVFSAEGDEATPITGDLVNVKNPDASWRTITLCVGKDIPALSGKNLAMIALRFEWANDLDLSLGEFSIIRPGVTSQVPQAPVVTKAEALGYTKDGVDGKIIFDMASQKGNTETVYNIDVKTSLFKIYSQQEGGEPKLEGITTSWAALVYDASMNPALGDRIRFGVSAVSLDMQSESETAWSDYIDCASIYTISDDIVCDREEIATGEKFTVAFADSRHQAASWRLTDINGKTVAAADATTALTVTDGLAESGIYTISVADNPAMTDARTFNGLIQILPNGSARTPVIENLDITTGSLPEGETAPGESFDAVAGQPVDFSYTGRRADGVRSRGLRIGGDAFGTFASDLGIKENKSFAVSMWLRPDALDHNFQILSIRDKSDSWPSNTWGFMWQTFNPQTKRISTTFKGQDANLTMEFDEIPLQSKGWIHLTMSFRFDQSGRLTHTMAINGKKVECARYTLGDSSGDGSPAPKGNLYPTRPGNILAVGGALHTTAGFEGTIDEFTFYDKALDETQMEAIYRKSAGLHTTEVPDPTVAFSFDKDSDNYNFSNEADSGIDCKAGTFRYAPAASEGTGTLVWLEPGFTAGAPFAASSRRVTTTASWTAGNADIETSGATDTAGKATIRFRADGTYGVGLRLANECGEDFRVYDFIRVAKGVGIGNITDDGCENGLRQFRLVSDRLILSTSSAGAVSLRIYDLGGRLIEDIRIDDAYSAPACVDFRHPRGIYIVSVTVAGEKTESFRIRN